MQPNVHRIVMYAMHIFESSSIPFEFYQHGGEGRLCEKFGDAMQHLAGDDVR